MQLTYRSTVSAMPIQKSNIPVRPNKCQKYGNGIVEWRLSPHRFLRSRLGKLIPHVAHGHNEFRISSILFYFVSQMTDMHIDDPGVAKKVVIPHAMQKLLAAQHFASML